MKRLNKKGFTMAELLIVVAIIAVLVAIAIPIFTSQLEKSKQAVDEANTRSAYAEAVADYLDDNTLNTTSITLSKYTFTAAETSGKISVSSTTCASDKYKNGISYDGSTFTATGSNTNP